METEKSNEEVIAWASGFMVDNQLQELTGSPASMVQNIVEKELIVSLNNNDSGLLYNYTTLSLRLFLLLLYYAKG